MVTAAAQGILEGRLGYRFRNGALCETALTHTSWMNEKDAPGRSDNERLEFLGDAVLSLVVSDVLMKRFPDVSEGELSKARATVVSEAGLARAADAIGLGEWIFLGRGEEADGGRRRPSNLANALEALLGAVYLDGGFAAAFAVAERLLGPGLDEAHAATQRDFKSRLQERTQAFLGAAPVYAVVGETGPDHAKTFEVVLTLAGRSWGRATGRSKKEAEQRAAAQALAALEAGRVPEGD